MLSVIHDARKEQVDAVRDRHDLLVSEPSDAAGAAAAGPSSTARSRPAVASLLPLDRVGSDARSTQDGTGPGTRTGSNGSRSTSSGSPAQGVPVPGGSAPKLVPKKHFNRTARSCPSRPRHGRPPDPAILQLSNWSQVATAIDRVEDADHRADRYEVEVHKKSAISLACISFVIIGIVMALRFPRGGIGLVIAVGSRCSPSITSGLLQRACLTEAPPPMALDVGAQHYSHLLRHHRPHPGESRESARPGAATSRKCSTACAIFSAAGARPEPYHPGGLFDPYRYVLKSWIRIFVLTALGFPVVSILINLTDTLNRLLDRGLSVKQIAISYIYSIPENAFLVMPAAVLFATVFTVGAMGRHSELTAAKAGGLSFYRLMLPVFGISIAATFLAFTVGELAPGATARQLEIQGAKQARPTRTRFNFVYRGDAGWVYTIRSLDVSTRQLKQVLFERQGASAAYPDLIITPTARATTTRFAPGGYGMAQAG